MSKFEAMKAALENCVAFIKDAHIIEAQWHWMPIEEAEAALALPDDEPVAWLVERHAFRVSPHGEDAEGHDWLEVTEPEEPGAFAVYAAPQPEQPAQELTDEEIIRIEAGCYDYKPFSGDDQLYFDPIRFARAIEAKLNGEK